MTEMRFREGDKVYYIGRHRTLQHDYGSRELTIFAVDAKTGFVVCTTVDNCWLVGVDPGDLQLAKGSGLQFEQEAS